MNFHGSRPSLNEFECKIVKRLLKEGRKSQDILAIVNKDRSVTVNFGRITPVKKNPLQVMADLGEMSMYLRFKESFDPKTGLNPFLNERLIKSRDAI